MALIMVAIIGMFSSMASNEAIVKSYIIAYLIIDTLLWIVSLILLLKSDKEKALLLMPN
jgi:hypothetical protein